MTSSNISDTFITTEKLRLFAKDALEKHMYGTAIALAEEIVRLDDSVASDQVFLASCLYSNLEYRRCLSFLEQTGHLSASTLSSLGDLICPDANRDADKHISSSSVTQLNDLQLVQQVIIPAVLLAAQCMLALERYEDCLGLLEGLVATEEGTFASLAISCGRQVHVRVTEENSSRMLGLNPVTGLYCAAAKCHDKLDNIEYARRCLCVAVQIDPACTEAADMLVHQCHLNADQKRQLLLRIDFTEREWLTQYYKGIFEVNENSGIAGMSENPSATPHIVPVGLTTRVPTESSVSGLLRRAQYLLANSQQSSEAYRLARLAYIKDPYNMHAVLVFISCLVELSLAPELFYLGHELTSHNPKQAVPWYAVGCYYWCCRKLDLAQKYLMKCTKIDKRFAPGFVMLGHVLGAQEEREHAVSALRTACRLLPGDHRPLVLMAKELMKMNCVSLALHLLSGASEIAQNDPVLLNELGVAFLRLDRTEDALEYLSLSVRSLHRGVSGTNPGIGESFKEEDEVVRAGSRCTSGAEIYSNYATALRRTGLWERALQWYSLSVAEDPTDHDTHAAIGFTYHLLRRFDDAITSYHRALALNPGSAFCTEMLTRALEDSCLFADSTANTDDPEIQEDSETMQDDSFIDPLNDSSLALSS